MKELYERVIRNKRFFIVLFCMMVWCACWLIVHKAVPYYCVIYGISALALLAVFVWIYCAIRSGRFRYYKVYPVIALVVGLIYMVNLPVYTIPDEPNHLWKAYGISNHLLGISNEERDGVVYLSMRKMDADFPMKETGYNLKSFQNYILESRASESYEIVTTSNALLPSDDYPYIASGLGITVGRLLGLSTLKTFLLGRMFNLLLFISMITIALYLIPRGKSILFASALLPMSVQQGMSYSYDVWVIADSFLILALFLNLREKQVHQRRFYMKLVALVLCSALLIPMKSHAYILLCTMAIFLLCELLLNREKVDSKLSALLPLINLVVLVGAGVLFLLSVIKPSMFPNTTHVLSWSGTQGYTIGFLLRHPGELVLAFYNTVHCQFEYYHRTMIGDLLGWLEISVNPFVIFGFDVALLIATLNCMEDDAKETSLIRRYFAWIFVFTFVLINIGMLLSWSPIDVQRVVGLQGRYFIPILPLLLFALRGKRIEIASGFKRYLPMYILVLQFFMIDQLMTLV